MKKIVYVLKTKLHYYPPCISQIRMLKKLGIEIEVLYGTCHESTLELLEKEGINCKKIGNLKDENPKKIEKAISWINFRRCLIREMKNYDLKNTIFWFGTAETVLPLKGALRGKKYIVSLLELLDDDLRKIKLLKGIVKNAEAITVCEETRGHIMKYWWKLDRLPFIFPNKPFDQITDRKHTPSCEITENVISKIKDKNIIISQGLLQNTDELSEFAKALKTINKDYVLLLMGIDKYNSVEKIKKIYDNTIYVSYIPAPLHLEITSYARIGITFYRPDNLNKTFCAPNKIYEFSGFGIPIIANDIPGLRNTVGIANAAECIELKEKNIIKAINKIEDNYDEYSKNSLNFFASTDNLETMKRLLEYINE